MIYEQIRTYFSLLKVQFRYKINKINYFKRRNVHLIQHVDYNKSTHGGKKKSNDLCYCFYLTKLNYTHKILLLTLPWEGYVTASLFDCKQNNLKLLMDVDDILWNC